MRPVRRSLWPCLMFAALCLLPGRALCSKPRCRLERIEPTADGKGLRVLASIVELEGAVDTDHPAAAYRLLQNGKALGMAESVVPFSRSDLSAQVVLAVEVSALYAPAIEKIKDALHDFVESLPPRFKVKLILFGNDLEEPGPFIPGSALSPAIDDINPDDEGEILLLDALHSGLRALSRGPAKAAPGAAGDRVQPGPRKLIVLLSDGLNPTMDRKDFRQLGGLLWQGGVSLFPIAFSPRDDRGPLLNLGELAKRSAGTFRWARNADELKDRFQSLSEEMQKLQVLTFRGGKFSLDRLGQGDIALACGELTSNSIKLMDGPPPSPSYWKWLLGIVLGLIALWAAARGAVYLLDRRGSAPSAQRPPGPAPLSPPVTAGAAFTLVVIGGQQAGQRINLSGPLRIGKTVSGPGTLPITDDPTVSGQHCELRRDAHGYVLYDLGSTNGSFVNDRRVTGPTRLQSGDILRLGTGTQFKFRVD